MESSNSLPLISVCLATYNHEAFITQAIQSILLGGYPNVEIVVVDDGSTDKTFDLLTRIRDTRVISMTQKNSGPSVAMNRAIERSTGEYIATFSGDDLFLPGRLAKNLDFLLRGNYDLIFSVPEVVDENGVAYRDGEVGSFHHLSFRDSAKCFQLLFDAENFICASTSLGKAKVFKDGVAFNPASLQLQDFEKWIDCCKKYRMGLMQDRVVQYRFISDQKNLSGRSNDVRVQFELMMVYDAFFEGASDALLKDAFGDRFAFSEDPLRRELDLAFLYLRHHRPMIRMLGLKRLYQKMRSPAICRLLEEEYRFTLPDLFRLANEIDFMRLKFLAELGLGKEALPAAPPVGVAPEAHA